MSKIVLGLDPGTAITGFGVIRYSKSPPQYISCGYIATDKASDAARRLLIIAQSLDKIIRRYKPDLVAVENLFFAKNRTTAIAVAQARGVILATIAKHKLPLAEFTPLQVKQALTGYGRADKRQMQRMVQAILKLTDLPKPDDSADA